MPESSAFRRIFFSLTVLLLLPAGPAGAQMPSWSKPKADTSGRAVTEAQRALERDVTFLSSECCAGRASGTRGAAEAAFYILRRLRDAGLETTVQAFPIPATGESPARVGHNIIGILPPSGGAFSARTRWTVVLAAYDGLGVIDGRLYPGADSNASGVAALLALSGRLREEAQRAEGVLIVALDAHNAGRAGAAALCSALASGYGTAPATLQGLTLRQIRTVVNLDIIGSSLAPVDKYYRRHLIALSSRSRLGELEACNSGLGLRLYDSYYRSRDFTDLFFRRLGDQRPFLERGLSCVMFTSGITDHTNKVSDTAETLDYPVLDARIELIFRWLRKIIS